EHGNPHRIRKSFEDACITTQISGSTVNKCISTFCFYVFYKRQGCFEHFISVVPALAVLFSTNKICHHMFMSESKTHFLRIDGSIYRHHYFFFFCQKTRQYQCTGTRQKTVTNEFFS